jgi:hypothetical protein
MSGSGPGPAGPNTPDEITACELLIMKTNLASPDPVVLATLKKGDELEVVSASPTGPAQAMAKGKIAGSIVTPQLMLLLNCIEQGFNYVAIVRRLDGGLCEVEVRVRSR